MTHRSAIFALADKYIDELAAINPITATNLGISGHDDKLPDYSLAGSQSQENHFRNTLSALKKLTPLDDVDRIAAEVFKERLESSLGLYESMEMQRVICALASPASDIRQVFEMMDSSTPEGIDNIIARLHAMPRAFNSWRESLRDLHLDGMVAARRQVLSVAEQVGSHGATGYRTFALGINAGNAQTKLDHAIEIASESATSLANWLHDEYAALSSPVDAYGEERYAPWARHYTGSELNLRDTYEWGLADLAAINERMWRVAARVAPHAKSLADVAAHLDRDPKYALHGTEELLAYLRNFTDAAIERMEGTHFEIDDRIRFCDVRLAPEGSAAAAYYMPPSEDLSRPGTTWYPTMGMNEFTSWRNDSIWYHEAVPGHHLQCATVVLEQERLSRFQRTEGWTSGYGEGWALYAERLMDELGAFEDPGAELGFLSGQALRAARVVVDIGMHLGYKDEHGKVWNAESARECLIERALLEPEFAQSEVDRYLGIPGQAISYKVGERVWMQVREAAQARQGAAFDLKAFHAHALRMGPMGLDPFVAEMARW
ncbi:unannotated protein [freshwater metagenome]|uniref:Unannotated protein n=1 Tax=freshwater metagenome TaxID=449393 RepID=A0A6J7BM45_9ZZZZ|nr:DUF885 family protein [Actinomycetota bacterium]MSY51472.1 DUF885 family protein [Actinomycetota bacterium]MSY87701.1 DUF885 family protein [Actinomycetota bacterium]